MAVGVSNMRVVKFSCLDLLVEHDALTDVGVRWERDAIHAIALHCRVVVEAIRVLV